MITLTIFLNNKFMKKRYIFLILSVLSFVCVSCDDTLNLEPKDRVSPTTILSNEEGIRTWMANLYYRAPIEDFTYNRVGWHSGQTNHVGIYPDEQTGNAINSEFNHLIDGGGNFTWWGYGYLRDVNLLLKEVQNIKNLTEEQKKETLAEAHFLRGFGYFALAKRYGGVPIIKQYQEYNSNPDSLKVPRSTEKETWDYAISELDSAAAGLPSTRTGNDTRRATKWVALALKSRAALFAASIAKFGAKDGLEGEAVDKGLIHIDPSYANHYYEICMDACMQIMESGLFELYKPNPASPDEAVKNLLALFQDVNIAPQECMFIKGYGNSPLTVGAHSIDFWCNPYQTRDGSPHPGRMNPSLDLVDTYESYTNPGQSSPIVTTEDGNTNNYNGYDSNQKYLHYDKPYDIFKNKDARLWATVILPGTEWKGKTINIQAGYIQPDGKAVIEADKASIVVDGITYHTFGAASMDDYSGFDQSNLSCMTRTGFSFKKFLKPSAVENNDRLGFSTQDWPEIRFAEVLLNYAEAVVESGEGDANLAAKCLNATRRRAGHTVDISLTSENVQRERRVEFAFENKRWWDLIRRREFHVVFHNNVQKALDPVLDLRVSPPKYIFIRKNAIREIPLSFDERYYYNPIPGTTTNGCIQNPQW
jgi:hypothetical protein